MEREALLEYVTSIVNHLLRSPVFTPNPFGGELMRHMLTTHVSQLGAFAASLLIILSAGIGSVFAQGVKTNPNLEDPEKLVRDLYDQVTFPPGKSPDWKYIRSMFLNEATVVMRVSREETATFSLDGWILDFVNFINDRDVKKTGFEEKVVKTRSMVFGNIAHVLVLYTANIPGVTRSPQEGVDSFHLAKKDGRWWIVSILNEIPTRDRPKPEALN